MNINGQATTGIWVDPDDITIIKIIDQRWLPHEFVVEDLQTVKDFEVCIREMHVRGAPLIGSTGAFGMYVALLEASKSDNPRQSLTTSKELLLQTRPTAIDLSWGVERMHTFILSHIDEENLIAKTLEEAVKIKTEIVGNCKNIGLHGLQIIKDIYNKTNKPVNILTHCNAGWLATVDHGTATSPMYAAHDAGIPIHIWVDETRPRNQGARLTAWELQQHGIPCTIIADNVGGYLMQNQQVDLVITGSDRTTYTGDVANKIGTYLKALAARDNNIPFYVALPESTFDWTIKDGVKEIPIETRSSHEVHHIQGEKDDQIVEVKLTPKGSKAVNYAFDVTPARLVTGLITERGICAANEASILSLYPEKK